MYYESHWIESIMKPELPSGELLAIIKAGDKYGHEEMVKLAAFLGCDFEMAEHDGYAYYFSADTTEDEIDTFCQEKWPDRLVRYTKADGIEFDFEQKED